MKAVTRYLLSRHGDKVITRVEIADLCERFKVNPDYFMNHIIRYGYVIRILRGLYYVKTIEEFKLRKSLNPLRILSPGMNKLGTNGTSASIPH